MLADRLNTDGCLSFPMAIHLQLISRGRHFGLQSIFNSIRLITTNVIMEITDGTSNYPYELPTIINR